MADLPDFARFVDDEDDLCQSDLCDITPHEVPLKKITLEVIDSVLTSLSQTCIISSSRDFFKYASRSEVMERISFLDSCLVPRMKFTHTARERAWRNYHAAYVLNLPNILKLTGSVQTSAWLCLSCFEQLLNENYPVCVEENSEPEGSESITEDIKDIVNYIGGSVIQKLRQRCQCLQDSVDKEEQLHCLKHLSI